MQVDLKIARYAPGSGREPRFQSYTVEARPEERILDCLNRIKWEQDQSLGFRSSCGHGVCGSDAIKINGRCGLACQKLVRDYEGQELVIEPLPSFKVLKDLIVDLKPFFEKIESMRPYLINPSPPPDRERLQSPDDSSRVNQVIRCILCACCTASCPVVAQGGDFLGPAPLVWAFRQVFDSRDRDTRNRLKNLDSPEGAWGCDNRFECTRVCPKEIPVTKSINQLKREIETHLRGS